MSERRSAILDAFERLVARFGLEKTTMRDVADEIGVSVGSLYNEFENREEIVHDAITRLQDWIIAGGGAVAAEPDAPAAEALRAVLLGHVQAVTEAAHRNRAMLEIGIGLTRVKSIRERAMANRQRVKAALVARVQAMLDRGVADGSFRPMDAQRTARLLVDAIAEYWFPPLVVQRPQAEVLGDATALVDIMLDGIRMR